MTNTIIYQEDWVAKMQERLDHPTNWKAVCKVEYTDTKVLNNPYMSTVPAVQAGTRGTAYVPQDFAVTNESISIDTYSVLSVFVDRADLAQSNYAKEMELADRIGTLINEKLESAMLGQHAQWTNIGDNAGAIASGSTSLITVSATNIDDIIRGVKRIINVANGQQLAARNGIFIIWRAADFEILEGFIQANGFTTADMALKDGAVTGIRYMGVDHYVSNDHTANHVFAGVKNLFQLGILKSTYGQTVVLQDPPATGAGPVSGVDITSRVDYKFKAWTNTAPLLYDINVA